MILHYSRVSVSFVATKDKYIQIYAKGIFKQQKNVRGCIFITKVIW